MNYLDIISPIHPIGPDLTHENHLAEKIESATYSNFGQTIFNRQVSFVDFQGSNLSDVIFNKEVNNCNFLNTRLDGTVFNAQVTGFTCFSGANLNRVQFRADCDNTVIFIGSNLSEQAMTPIGGIQTVNDLKAILDAGQFSDEQVEMLIGILTLSCDEVEESLNIFSGMPYHINENHYDHIYRAKVTLEEYLQSHRVISRP